MTVPGIVSLSSRWLAGDQPPELSTRSDESWSTVFAGRASPKSSTRTRPSLPIITLSGLKSRWTRPARCAASMPRPAASNTRRISRQVRGRSASQVVSVTPSMCSIAMYTPAGIEPTS